MLQQHQRCWNESLQTMVIVVESSMFQSFREEMTQAAKLIMLYDRVFGITSQLNTTCCLTTQYQHLPYRAEQSKRPQHMSLQELYNRRIEWNTNGNTGVIQRMTSMTWLNMRSANSTGACLLSHSCMVLTMTFDVSIVIQLVILFPAVSGKHILCCLSVYKPTSTTVVLSVLN